MTTWRERFVTPSSTATEGRPDLATIFEHYGLELKHRVSQMVSCPLHPDDNPSCSVNTDKGVWRCHSCGEGGDSYRLVMRMESVGFEDAVAKVAEWGYDLTEAPDEPSGSRYGGGRRKSPQTKRKGGRGAYTPSWRRKKEE